MNDTLLQLGQFLFGIGAVIGYVRARLNGLVDRVDRLTDQVEKLQEKVNVYRTKP